MVFGIVVTTAIVAIVFAWALNAMTRHEEREGVREPMLVPVGPVAPLTRAQVQITCQLLIDEAQESYQVAAETAETADADQQRAYGDACLEIRELLWRAQPDERQVMETWN